MTHHGLTFAGREHQTDDRAAQQPHQHRDGRTPPGNVNMAATILTSAVPWRLLPLGPLVRPRHRSRGCEMSSVSIQQLSIRFGSNFGSSGPGPAGPRGEFLVLLGLGLQQVHSLHAIAGLIDDGGGRIEIGSRDMTEAEPRRGHRHGVPVLCALPDDDGGRSLSFRAAHCPACRRTRSSGRVSARADAPCASPLAKLSGGQRQRVAIGQPSSRVRRRCSSTSRSPPRLRPAAP